MTTIGRTIFGAVFIAFGAFHFIKTGMFAGAVPSWLPLGGQIWVYITGAGMIAAGVAFITKFKGRLAAYLLAVLLLSFILTIHAPKGNWAGLLKDLALLSACLMIAGSFGER